MATMVDGRGPITMGLLGGMAGAALLGGVAYSHGGDPMLGVGAGAVLVGMLGAGVARGAVAPLTLCGVIAGLFFGMIGPGCDDHGGVAVPPAALAGALIGRLVFGPRRHCGGPPSARP